jgi:hypothetical protein
MILFARQTLIEPTGGEPALLLEGDWPAGERDGERYSLDSSIDERHAWIDEAAVELSEHVAASEAGLSLAWINALALRYYFVKLLRPIAWFDEAGVESPVLLNAERGRDEDYADIIGQLCLRRGLRFDIRWHDLACAIPVAAPNSGWLRRTASWLNAALPLPLGEGRGERAIAQRVLLCGNPAILDPVCRELLTRGASVAWLYDRFAFRAWLRWQPRGVRQLTCDTWPTQPASAMRTLAASATTCRGIDLTTAVTYWMERVEQQHGARQARLVEHVERHIETWRPAAVALDEDATPLKRIVVACARRQDIRSLVVQHGAPRVRFGFAPLAADRFLAWGESSATQLAGWGVPRERITITGSPRTGKSSATKVLLFATTPPSDARPDAVEYHLTSRTHDDSLRMALAAVTGLPRARLTIKLHPRRRDSKHIERLIAEFPGLDRRVVRRGSLERMIRDADVILNCGSSAGIEAAYLGVPVIELLPAGSNELTPAEAWGLFGSAATFEELCELLDRALTHNRRNVFARTGAPAASAIVDAILAAQPHPDRVLEEVR